MIKKIDIPMKQIGCYVFWMLLKYGYSFCNGTLNRRWFFVWIHNNQRMQIIFNMKRLLISVIISFLCLGLIISQTAKTKTDYWGNKTTTYYNQKGQKTGTSKTTSDSRNNQCTIFRNSQGMSIGTARTNEDYWGNESVIYRNSKGQKI